MQVPYKSLDKKAFWKTGVVAYNPLDIKNLWQPKFDFSKNEFVCTFGSCFAQHISKALQKNNFSWFNGEIMLSKTISFISIFSQENNIVFIEQPKSTIVKKIFTSDIYSKNSVKLATENKPHLDTDFVHMNESYGNVLWTRMLENLNSFSEGKYTVSGGL